MNHLEPQTLGLLGVLKQLTKHFEPRPEPRECLCGQLLFEDAIRCWSREDCHADIVQRAAKPISTAPVPDEPQTQRIATDAPKGKHRSGEAREGTAHELEGREERCASHSRGSGNSLSGGVESRHAATVPTTEVNDFGVVNGRRPQSYSGVNDNIVDSGSSAPPTQTLRFPSASELQDARECGLPLDEQAMLAELPERPLWWMEEDERGLPFV